MLDIVMKGEASVFAESLFCIHCRASWSNKVSVPRHQQWLERRHAETLQCRWLERLSGVSRRSVLCTGR